MRRAAKVDRNQPEIIKAFRSLGASVQPLHAVGQGVPDLLVGFQRVNLLVEIKDGKKSPSKRKLNPGQVQWRDEWRGQHAVVETIDDVVNLIGSVR